MSILIYKSQIIALLQGVAKFSQVSPFAQACHNKKTIGLSGMLEPILIVGKTLFPSQKAFFVANLLMGRSLLRQVF